MLTGDLLKSGICHFKSVGIFGPADFNQPLEEHNRKKRPLADRRHENNVRRGYKECHKRENDSEIYTTRSAFANQPHVAMS